MDKTTELSQRLGSARESKDYARFIILGHPRTGSNMLASALNSSPNITCFWELFNAFAGFVDFHVDGYDGSSVEDRALRNKDFRRFLRDRIFCQHSPEIRAVGFKMPHSHFAPFPGLLEWLARDTELRVLHLKRRNLLKMLVSLRIAQTTGGWAEDRRGTLLNKFRPANALRAARHPITAANRLRKFLWPQEQGWKSRRAPVTLSETECRDFFREVEQISDRHSGLFRDHALLTLYYEDLLEGGRNAFDRVQAFLGVEPRTLSITTRRQNPEPLRELIANYGELRAAFEGTPEASFFE